MTLRGWQASCTECGWNVHAVQQKQVETAKRTHEQSTGHRDVSMYPVTQGDPTGRYSGSDLPPKSGGP